MLWIWRFRGLWLWFLGFLITIIVICAIVYFAYKIFRNNNNENKFNLSNKLNLSKSDNLNNKALEILNERYSKGEISDEEYNFKKNQILR